MDISLGLVGLGMVENYASDLSTYEKMVATWRDANIPIPSKADLQAASDKAAIMHEWEEAMLESDTTQRMSREMEEHITEEHAGTAGNPDKQKRYQNKKDLRNAKPQ